MGRACSQNGGTSALKILTGKHIGKRPLGRPRRRSEANIRMDLEEICTTAAILCKQPLFRSFFCEHAQ